MAEELVLEKNGVFIPGQQMSPCFLSSAPQAYKFITRCCRFRKATLRITPDLILDCPQLSVTWSNISMTWQLF